jgi:hypothetical protein
MATRDISKLNTAIPRSFVKNMISRVNAFVSINKKNPKIVYITVNKVDYVSYARYTLMKKWYDTHKKDKTIPVLKSGSIGSTKPASKTTTEKTVSGIYVSGPPKTLSKAAQKYQGKTTPYFGLTLTYTLFSANSAEFKSPLSYEKMSRVNIFGNHENFGGQIVDVKEANSDAGYDYSCLDNTRRLFGKQGLKFYQFKVSEVIKILLKQRGMVTSGIMTTTKVHDKVIIDTAKVIDIIQQLTNLEDNLEFFINSDGIPILRKIPDTTKGYVFFTEQSASDYSLDYDDTNIITGISVFGKDGVLLYDYTDTKLIVKYGSIRDILDDSNLTNKSDAKAAADKVLRETGKTVFAGSITIPSVFKITDGEWIIFAPPKWSANKLKAYYTQEVKISIEAGNENTAIQFLAGKPAPPSEWIYVSPDGESTSSCTASGSSIVCAVAKPSVSTSKYSYRNYLTCFINEDPSSGKKLRWNPKGVPEGEWTSENDNDFCAVTGKKKINGSKLYLKRVSGPTPTNAGVGKVKNSATDSSTCSSPGSGLPSGVTNLQSLYDWFWIHIKYKFYWNSKHTPDEVLKIGMGNCVDQSALAVRYIKKLGFEVKTVHLNIPARLCGGWSGGHVHLKIKYNGAWRVWDTTCHKASFWKH